jgi:hypothetical protein
MYLQLHSLLHHYSSLHLLDALSHQHSCLLLYDIDYQHRPCLLLLHGRWHLLLQMSHIGWIHRLLLLHHWMQPHHLLLTQLQQHLSLLLAAPFGHRSAIRCNLAWTNGHRDERWLHHLRVHRRGNLSSSLPQAMASSLATSSFTSTALGQELAPAPSWRPCPCISGLCDAWVLSSSLRREDSGEECGGVGRRGSAELR